MQVFVKLKRIDNLQFFIGANCAILDLPSDNRITHFNPDEKA